MMKHTIPLIFLTTLLSTSLVYSEASKPSGKADKIYGEVVVQDNTALAKMLTIPEVKTQYDLCSKAFPDQKDLAKIPDCLWNGTPKDSTKNIPALNDDVKKQVQAKYAQEDQSKNARSPASAGDTRAAQLDAATAKDKVTSKYTGKSDNIFIDYKSDPAVKALSDFYSKKLEEVLTNKDDKTSKTITTVDHEKFIQLYSSELGKSVINAFTSYCMQTDPVCRKSGGVCIIPQGSDDNETRKLRKDAIEANIKDLKDATFSKEEGTQWTSCIAGVSTICYDDVKKSNDYSKQQACLIVDFVKSARKNLMIAEQQKKFYDGLGPNVTLRDSGLREVSDKKLNADDVTSLTSADLNKDFTNTDNKKENIAAINTNLTKEASDCVDAASGGSTDKCKKLIETDSKTNTEAVTDFGLRQLAQGDDLKEKLLKDKTTIAAYLKEEGYADNQIKDLTSDAKIEDIKTKIQERFNAEKQAIITAMAEKVTGKTTTTDGTIDAKTDAGKLSQIRGELQTRNTDMANLIHFNNIVASYLSVEEKGKPNSASRNTASLYAEINSDTTDDGKALKKKIEANPDLKQNSNTADLKVDDINKLLQYRSDQVDASGSK